MLTILRFFFLFSSPHTYFHWSKTNSLHTALTACTCMHLTPVLSSGLCSLCSCCSFSPDTSFPFLCIFSNPYHSSRSSATSVLHTASPECSLVFPHSFALVLVMWVSLCVLWSLWTPRGQTPCWILFMLCPRYLRQLSFPRSLISPLSFTSEMPMATCTKLVIHTCLLIGWFICCLY